MKHGAGALIRAEDGSVFEGTFKYDKAVHGKLAVVNGDVYEGALCSDAMLLLIRLLQEASRVVFFSMAMESILLQWEDIARVSSLDTWETVVSYMQTTVAMKVCCSVYDVVCMK